MLGESGQDAFFAFKSVVFVVFFPKGGKVLEQIVELGEGQAG